jgi:hypothetical protein
VEERSGYGDLYYRDTWLLLQHYTSQELALQNATWHRSCYQEVTNTRKLKRAKEKCEKEDGPTSSKRKKEEGKKLTWSQTCPYNKELCFFCDQAAGNKDPLHSVSTMSAGQSIRAAVEILGDEKMQTKLATSIDANDAHAIDIKYHKNCYLNNLTNILRRSQFQSSEDNAETAGRIEFLHITRRL